MFLNRVEETHLIYQQKWMAEVKYALRGFKYCYICAAVCAVKISHTFNLLKNVITKAKRG